MVQDLADEMQLQMDLPTIVQTKAEMAILDTALFYTTIIKKLLLLAVDKVALVAVPGMTIEKTVHIMIYPIIPAVLAAVVELSEV